MRNNGRDKEWTCCVDGKQEIGFKMDELTGDWTEFEAYGHFLKSWVT